MSAQIRVIHSDPNILGGTPVFVGTRVPVVNLMDYLLGGDTLDEFLDAFPTVTREQAVAALEIARDILFLTHAAGGRSSGTPFDRDALHDRT